MNLIRASISYPVAVIAVVLMALLFGWLALTTIPIQLAPDVSRPVIQIRTVWTGTSPVEIEREIIIPQEDALKGLENLASMTARANRGQANVELEFMIGTDMDRTLLLVANRLDLVADYPDEVNKPTISSASSEDNPIAWFRLVRKNADDKANLPPIATFGDYMEDMVKPQLERVTGVGDVNIFGGTTKELQIIINPERLASYQLTISSVVTALRASNIAMSGGNLDEGKRSYIVRMDNELKDPESIRNLVLRSQESNSLIGNSGLQERIRIGDIAEVGFGYPKVSSILRANGKPAIGMSITRESGVNVIEVMKELKQTVNGLNQGILAAQGLELVQVYDETVYIQSAIDLVLQNIWVGGLLAVMILIIFLRSMRATLVIAIAIPISVIASFVAMAALGRSLNVVSLAGIAFAIGMVVDAAIVVLENIYRLRQSGMSSSEAAYQGASRVWGAVLVSALTTVLAFLPVLIMDLEVGQLFRDIAVAICVSVLLSLLVAVTVIPSLASRFLSNDNASLDAPILHLPVIDSFASKFVDMMGRYTKMVVTHPKIGGGLVASLVGLSVAGGIYFLPDLEYLPEGNRNFVFGIISPPPGYNLEASEKIAEKVEKFVLAQLADSSGNSPKPENGEAAKPALFESFFFSVNANNNFIAASAVDQSRAADLIPILRNPLFNEPGTFGFFSQPSIFGRGIGGARTIQMDISGGELDAILDTARIAAGLIEASFPANQGNQVRPRPGLELGAPELRILPDPVKLADNQLTALSLGQSIDAFNDSLLVSEITVDGKLMDLVIKGASQELNSTQDVGYIPVVTGEGKIVQVDSLATLEITAGPSEIRHSERLRTISLELRPNPAIPLGVALEKLNQEVVTKLENGILKPGQQVILTGTADSLAKTWDEMKYDLVYAMIIVFLVMAVLYGDFLYPIVIMITVPTAAIGGLVGLKILGQFQNQSLDMLTLLGFVILIGTVVNNAILVVHQSLYHIEKEGMSANDGIIEACRNRIRPIFMSTLTSVFGMLPLVLLPGAGSEIYRGLGSVVVGGLTLSAFVTLFMIPALMTLLIRIRPIKSQIITS